MLQFYLTTVVIWMIIIYATIQVLGPTMKEKGWVKDNTSTKRSGFSTLLTVAAVPILRLLIWIFLFIASMYTREQIEEWGKR